MWSPNIILTIVELNDVACPSRIVRKTVVEVVVRNALGIVEDTECVAVGKAGCRETEQEIGATE